MLFLSRQELASRWSCSRDSIIRYERIGRLKRFVLGAHLVRYSLAEIERIENECATLKPEGKSANV
jgi:hypothetical protein